MNQEFLLQVVDGAPQTLLFTKFMRDKELCEVDLFQFESVIGKYSITIANCKKKMYFYLFYIFIYFKHFI